MTKKHFEEAARIVREEWHKESLKRAICAGYIMLFKQFNPRFDEERFEKACGL